MQIATFPVWSGCTSLFSIVTAFIRVCSRIVAIAKGWTLCFFLKEEDKLVQSQVKLCWLFEIFNSLSIAWELSMPRFNSYFWLRTFVRAREPLRSLYAVPQKVHLTSIDHSSESPNRLIISIARVRFTKTLMRLCANSMFRTLVIYGWLNLTSLADGPEVITRLDRHRL